MVPGPLGEVRPLAGEQGGCALRNQALLRETEIPQRRERLREVLRASWTIDALLALLLTGWYYRYGLGRLHDHLYDTFDQKAMIYLLEWLYHSFFGEGHIMAVFNANILYPNANVLAWSDTLLGFLPVYALVRSVTLNPILALNCVALLGVFAATLGMLRLGRDFTGRVAILAGVVGGVGMLVASQEGHFQLKALSLLIWALLLIVRFIRGSGRVVPWLIAVSSWLFLCSLYYAIMLAVFIATSLLLALVLGRRRFLVWLREALRGVPVVRATVVLGASLIPVGWVGYHYLKVKGQFGGGYNLEAFVRYSGRLGSLLDAPATSLIYRSMYSDWGSHEARLFFGLLVWVGVVFLIAGWRRWSMTVIDRRIVALLGFGALLATVLALGPFERDALQRGVHVPLPAYLYARFFPGYSALRSAGRFGIFAAVFMALLAELGTRNLLDLIGLDRARATLTYGGLAALFLLEQTTILRPLPVELIARRPIYEAIRVLTPPEAVVLELPVAKHAHFENISWWHEQMLGSTVHWRRIPVGFTSLESETLGRLVQAYSSLESGLSSPKNFVEDLRLVGITHVVLDVDLVPADLATRMRRQFAASGFGEAAVTSRVSIFRVSAAPDRSE